MGKPSKCLRELHKRLNDLTFHSNKIHVLIVNVGRNADARQISPTCLYRFPKLFLLAPAQVHGRLCQCYLNLSIRGLDLKCSTETLETSYCVR